MKYFLITIGLHNSEKGVWFDDVIVKGGIPDNLDLIEDLKSKYFSKIIGITSVREVQYEESKIQSIIINRLGANSILLKNISS